MDKVALESSLNALDIWLIVFGILVAIGVVGESVVGFLHWRRSGQLQVIQTAENLALTNSIAAANVRAAEAQLALEKLKTPRSLSPQQMQSIAAKLRPFANTPFDLSAIVGDTEAIKFVGFIADTLQAAGWKWIEYNHPTGPFMTVYNMPGKPNIGQQGWEAVSIEVFSDHEEQLSKAADALAVALRTEGVAATRDVASDAIPNHDTIHILIGRKPL